MEFIDLTTASEDERYQVKGILSNVSRNLEFTCGNKLKNNKYQNGNKIDNKLDNKLDQNDEQQNNQKSNIQINNSNNSTDQSTSSTYTNNTSNTSNNSFKNGFHYNNSINSTHNHSSDDNQISNNHFNNHQNNHYNHHFNIHNSHPHHHNSRGFNQNPAVQFQPSQYTQHPHFIANGQTNNGQFNGGILTTDSHHQPHSHLNHHQYKMPYFTQPPPFTNSSKPFYPTANAYNVLTNISPIATTSNPTTTQNGLIVTNNSINNQQQLNNSQTDDLNQRTNLVVSTNDYHPINNVYTQTTNGAPPNSFHPHLQAPYIPHHPNAPPHFPPHPMFYFTPHPLHMPQFYPAHYAAPHLTTAQPTINPPHHQLATPPISPQQDETNNECLENNGDNNCNLNNSSNCDNEFNQEELNVEEENCKNDEENQLDDKQDKLIDNNENNIELLNSESKAIDEEKQVNKNEINNLNDIHKFTEDISDTSFNITNSTEKSYSEEEEHENELNSNDDEDVVKNDEETYGNNETNELENKLDNLNINEEDNNLENNDDNKIDETVSIEKEQKVEEEQVINDTKPNPQRSWADLFKSNKANYNKPSKILMDSELGDKSSTTESSNNLFNTDDFGPLGQQQIESSFVKLTSSRLQQTIKSVPLEEDEIFPKLSKKLKDLNLKHSLPLLIPRGFTNKSNWCYINSILQALLYCPPFYNLMREIGETQGIFREKSATPIIDSFAKFFTNFMPNEQLMRKVKTSNQFGYDDLPKLEPYEPKCIYNVLGNINNECLKGKQEDAEEFLSSVLNCLHEEMLLLLNYDQKTGQTKQFSTSKNNENELEISTNSNKSTNVGQSNEDEKLIWKEVKTKHKTISVNNNKLATPITDIFGGYMSLVRTAGKDVNHCRQPFFSLKLDIHHDKIRTIEDALKNLTSSESIHGFTCPKTNKIIEASTQTFLETLPAILVLHLKLHSDDNGNVNKLMKKISFPVDLEIPKECLTNQERSKYSKNYKLLSVVHHDGKEQTKGHYITDIYHIGTSLWLRCDDSNIESISIQQLMHPQNLKVPYLLFYRRCDTLRGSSKNQN